MAPPNDTPRRRVASKGTARKAPAPKLVPYARKPDDMSLEAWQRALRRQYHPAVKFRIEKLDVTNPVFGDYAVYNPESASNYKVALRSREGDRNFCECLDFKTNHLGTCKHIEAVIRHLEAKRGLKKILKEGYEPPYSSVYLAYGEVRRVKLRIGSDKAEKFAALASAYFDADMVLRDEAFARFNTFVAKAKALDLDFRCYDDAMAFVLETRERQRRASRLDSIEKESTSLEGLLRTTLYEYQREGIFFAAKAGRAMIADEMGLGKTVQAIGAAMLLRREAGAAKVLVVCPTSLKYQWRSEIERFTGESSVVVEGPPLSRREMYSGEAVFTIASYHVVGRDIEAIDAMEPDLIILDEAQRIKNWKTKLARNVKRLRSRFAFVLTGTPLENNLEDLYSILEVVDPFKLGPYRAFLAAHESRDGSGKLVGYRALNEVGILLSDIVIRRRKREVLAQLPERIDERRFVPLTDRQREVHEEYQEKVALLVRRWKRQGFLIEQDRQRLLQSMNCMRMVCDSTYILDQRAEDRHDTKIDELFELLDQALEEPETKVVIFSQWERMTRLVAVELENRGIGFEHLYGAVLGNKRKALFDRFNTDLFCRVFLSTDAGSTGLNLQSASILVNLDLPWNPAVLEQRIARIHRIGQTRGVHIVNFVSADTIESRMLSILGFKADLASGILDGGDDAIFLDDEKYGRFMENVGKLIGAEDGAEPDASGPAIASGRPESGSFFEEEEREELASEVEVENEGEPPSTAPRAEPEHSEAKVAAEAAGRMMGALEELSRVLASPESTRRFVSGLMVKDGENGQSYLRIPVKDEESAVGALSLFGNLLAALGAKK